MQVTKHPDTIFIVAGDFYHCNLRTVLPKFNPFVIFATRDYKTLDHVYCSVLVLTRQRHMPTYRPVIQTSAQASSPVRLLKHGLVKQIICFKTVLLATVSQKDKRFR